MKRQDGFTLIELLVVLAVIAMLVAIVAPNYTRHVEHARELALRQDLTVMRDAIDKFRSDQGRSPATLAELVAAHYLRDIPEDPVTERADSWTLVPAPDGGVGDVHSGSTAVAADGRGYKAW